MNEYLTEYSEKQGKTQAKRKEKIKISSYQNA